MRKVTFIPAAMDDIEWWTRVNAKMLIKVFDLAKESAKEPFSGKGNPEPLKGNLKGYWSRRITEADRLVYKVSDDEIVVISAKGHYI